VKDWTTTDGKTYKNVTVVSHDGTIVTISSADGPATFPISLLNSDLQKRINDDHVTSTVWTTTEGKTYTNVQVVKHDEASVTILDSDGGALIPLQILPTDLQQKFGYDPAKIEAEAKEKAAADIAAAAARADQARQAALAYVRDNTKTIKEVETDQASFVGKMFIIEGSIALSTYYNYGYSECSITHYSFHITQGNREAYAYMAKGNPYAETLRKKLLASDDPLDGLFTVVIDPRRFNPDSGQLLVQLCGNSATEESATANATSPDTRTPPSAPKQSDTFNPGSMNDPVTAP
jgi:hypothetical protein